MQRNTDNDNGYGYGYGRVARITISDATIERATTSESACKDYSDVESTKLDGGPSQGFHEAGAPQLGRTTFSLSPVDGAVT